MNGTIKIYWIFLVLIWCSCSKSDELSIFTGNESVYTLRPGAVYGVGGTVTLREKQDGSTLVRLALEPSTRGLRYPVHLHRGKLADSGAAIAAVLNSVVSEQGISETAVSHLADEARITYRDLLSMDFCIKVHLSDIGAERDIVLSGTNVGGRSIGFRADETFGVCKSK